LPKEYFKQVEQVYGEHFPLEVRFIFCMFFLFLLLYPHYFGAFAPWPKHDPIHAFRTNF
jgi:hypothetical protein